MTTLTRFICSCGTVAAHLVDDNGHRVLRVKTRRPQAKTDGGFEWVDQRADLNLLPGHVAAVQCPGCGTEHQIDLGDLARSRPKRRIMLGPVVSTRTHE